MYARRRRSTGCSRLRRTVGATTAVKDHRSRDADPSNHVMSPTAGSGRVIERDRPPTACDCKRIAGSSTLGELGSETSAAALNHVEGSDGTFNAIPHRGACIQVARVDFGEHRAQVVRQRFYL